MKKPVSLILAVLFIISLVSCAKTQAPQKQKSGSADVKISENADEVETGKKSVKADLIFEAIESDDYDNKTEYLSSFSMSAEEFKKAILSHFPAPKHRPYSTDENSADDDYLIKAGTLSVYAHDDKLTIALVITKDTHDLGDMRVVVFKSGIDAEFGVYKMRDLISDFGRSEKGAETCDSAIYLAEKDGQVFLFVESAKGYTNGNTDYTYELRSYIVDGHFLNFCSDLQYKGALGKRLTSRSLPMGFAEEHYTKDTSAYVLYCEGYASGDTEYTEIRNDFTKISEAVSAYFDCFGTERSKLVRKADACRIYYGDGIEKIADFSFHARDGGASIALTDNTGILR